MAETIPPDWLIAWAEFALKRAKLSFDRIVRVFPPDGESVEVLLIDRFGRPVTAVLTGKGELDEYSIGW